MNSYVLQYFSNREKHIGLLLRVNDTHAKILPSRSPPAINTLNRTDSKFHTSLFSKVSLSFQASKLLGNCPPYFFNNLNKIGSIFAVNFGEKCIRGSCSFGTRCSPNSMNVIFCTVWVVVDDNKVYIKNI